MVAHDWSECPHCKFPAIGSKFKLIVESTGSCTMCYSELQPSDIVIKKRLNPISKKDFNNSESQNFIKPELNQTSAPTGGLAL
jgi:WD repeat-containing protein 19